MKKCLALLSRRWLRQVGIPIVASGLLGLWLVSSGGVVFAAKQHQRPISAKAVKTKQLVSCPVTGSKIDPAKAYAKTVYKGKTYYFCCAGCPEEFKKNPVKYVR